MPETHKLLDDFVAGYLTSPLPLADPGVPNPNAGLTIDANGRLLVEAFEGYERVIGSDRVTTYYDSVGVLTLGYGHTNLGGIPPRISQGNVWDRAQADAVLSADMAQFNIDVRRYFPHYELTQNQFDALVSFDFNTGALGRSSLPAKINAGRITAAMDTLLQYNHAGGQVLAGLTRRRRAERLMFLGDVQSALVLAGAHLDTRMPMSKATTAPGGET